MEKSFKGTRNIFKSEKINELEKSKQELSAEIDSLRQGLNDKDNEIQSLRNKYNKWKNRSKEQEISSNQKISESTKTKKNLTSEIDDLHKALEAKEKENQILLHKYNKWKNLSKEQEISSNQKINELEKSKQELSAEIDSLRQGLNDKDNEIQSLRNKYNKWKNRSKDQKHDSNSSSEQLLKENINYKEQITTLSRELSSSRLSTSSQISELESQIKSLSTQLSDLQRKLVCKQARLDSLTADNDRVISSLKESETVISHLKSDNCLLYSKYSTLKSQIHKNISYIGELKSQTFPIFDKLCGSFDPRKALIRLNELINTSNEVTNLKNENEILNKRINAALENNKANSNEELIEVHKKLKKEIEQKEIKFNYYKSKNILSNVIIETLTHLLFDIKDLYSSVCETNFHNLRPLILSFIFIKRIKNLKNFENDSAFSMVYAVKTVSFISNLRNAFYRLSQDLLTSKQNLLDNIQQLNQVSNERDEMRNSFNSITNENQIIQLKLKHSENRINELQQELSTLISPNAYSEIIKSNEQLKDKFNEINAQNDKLQNEIHEQNEQIASYKTEIINLKNQLEDKTNKIETIQTKNLFYEKEIERIEKISQDKINEIVALERILHKQREEGNIRNAAVRSLVSENKILHNNLQKMKQNNGEDIKFDEKLLATNINPMFLGK
ncbi:structural maintenance of chromosome [Histomonas meleagridis]|nr:structural maintenance of chromosome [Histomonas meleagridis]